MKRAQKVATTKTFWSDETDHIFELPRESELNDETFLNCVYLDDREYVDRSWKACRKVHSGKRTIFKNWAQLLESGNLSPEKIKTGIRKTFLTLELVNLLEILRSAIELILPMAEQKLIQIIESVGQIPRFILADSGRMKQVFWNYLINSLKFTPIRGGIDVIVRVNDRESDLVQVQFHDTGKGIASDFLPHLFDRFSQVDSSSRAGRSQA